MQKLLDKADSTKTSPMKIFSLLFLSAVILTALVLLVFEWLPVSDGSPNEDIVVLLDASTVPLIPLVLLSLVGVVFIPVGLIASIFVRRIWGVNIIVLCLLFALTITTTFMVPWVSWWIRRAAFARVAERGEVLIKAIEAYNDDKGKFPTSLDELVPEYLEQVPGTGLRGFPDYRYTSTVQYGSYETPYQLMVHCSSGFLNFDSFFYWPSQDYPEAIYGGSTERIGKWAYVHE